MNSSQKTMLTVVVVVLLGAAAWGILTMPDQRSMGQRIGDAADALPQGVGPASRELQDRTPGARLGDSIKDAGQNLKDSTNK